MCEKSRLIDTRGYEFYAILAIKSWITIQASNSIKS